MKPLKLPNRLKEIRILNNMEISEVAKKTNISEIELTSYENDIFLLEGVRFERLLDFYGASNDFLFMYFPPDLKRLRFSFRKRDESVRRGDVERVKRCIKDVALYHVISYINLYNNYIKKTNIKVCDTLKSIDLRDKNNIDEVCKKLRNKCEIGNGVIESVTLLLEKCNINVIELNVPNDIFVGVSSKIDNKFFIFINKNKRITVESQRFTLLHEFYHILLGSFKNNRGEEMLCDSFASHMLFPDKEFDRFVKELPKIESVCNFENVLEDYFINTQQKYGISISTICYKLKNRNYISDDVYKKIIEYIIENDIDVERFQNKEKTTKYEDMLSMGGKDGKITLGKKISIFNTYLHTYSDLL